MHIAIIAYIDSFSSSFASIKVNKTMRHSGVRILIIINIKRLQQAHLPPTHTEL